MLLSQDNAYPMSPQNSRLAKTFSMYFPHTSAPYRMPLTGDTASHAMFTFRLRCCKQNVLRLAVSTVSAFTGDFSTWALFR